MMSVCGKIRTIFNDLAVNRGQMNWQNRTGGMEVAAAGDEVTTGRRAEGISCMKGSARAKRPWFSTSCLRRARSRGGCQS
eukprot:scaffold552393_cov42-Prasinocladus_malaysianus.AAC.1